MEDQVAALLAELDELRQDNAALQEALRLAQLGGVDLQGHLSKYNPDAAEQGIFTQDWELRYFVLSGNLLKYYTSERDVGRNYRGVLSLEDCIVAVEQPTSAKGPFIFLITDPEGEPLLRLSADRLSAAKTWVKTLQAVGLRVRGYKRLAAVTQPGWQPPSTSEQQQQQGGLGRFGTLSSFGRAISGKWSSATLQPYGALGGSLDSDMSIRYDSHAQLQQEGADAAAAAAAAESQEGAAMQQQQQQAAAQRAQQQQQHRQALALGSVVLSDDDTVPSDDDDEAAVGRLSRLRRKCKLIKRGLSHRIRRSRDAALAVAAAAGAAAVGGGSSSNSSLYGSHRPTADGVAAAAAAAAADGSSSAAGSMLAADRAAFASASSASPFSASFTGWNRRTPSAPLQKQVSKRWELADRGDELPEAEHSELSDDSGLSDISSSGSTHAAPYDASLQPTSHQQQQEQQEQQEQLEQQLLLLRQQVQPPLQQQQQQQFEQQFQPAPQDAFAGLQQQQPGHGMHHLEGIQEQDEDAPKRPQRLSAFGEATEAAAIAAAGGVSAALPEAAALAAGAGMVPGGPSAPPPAPSAALAAALRSGFKPGSVTGSLKPQGTGAAKPKRSPMLGHSPVHVSVKDSILTDTERHSVMRHEGFFNLGVVVLLATNVRMIIGNLMTYGLRMKVNSAVLQSLLPLPLSRDDIHTLVAIPLCCVLFALGALGIEWLGLKLLLAQEKLLQGRQKKGVPAATLAERGVASMHLQEGLLLLLNLLNAGGSLVLPCALVLSNKSSLVPAFVLTVVAVVTSMKLATYAHCNTSLRCEARARAIQAAAAGWPIPCTTLQPVGGRTGSYGWGQLRSSIAQHSMRPDPAALVTAATHTAAAGAASSGRGTASLRTSNTDPTAFLAAGLCKTSSFSRRRATAKVVVGTVAYPRNLTAHELAYFLAAPTLTYQLNFPRLRQRRWRLLSRWLLLALLTALAMSFMQVQFLMPCMQSSLVPLREMNLLRFMERLLRLAVPNTAVWLAMFYLVFHLWLNILGELLLFGDRMFYKEWWNASTLADYWKLWNIPVHKWMLRTIFFPLVRRGAPRMASLLFVFCISAVMHELAVGVPLRMLRGWAFWGMMLQVPLITLTEVLRKRLKADTLGNMVFWLSFCVLGQPMCLVLYYHDWLLANLGEQGWLAAAAQGDDAAGVLMA